MRRRGYIDSTDIRAAYLLDASHVDIGSRRGPSRSQSALGEPEGRFEVVLDSLAHSVTWHFLTSTDIQTQLAQGGGLVIKRFGPVVPLLLLLIVQPDPSFQSPGVKGLKKVANDECAPKLSGANVCRLSLSSNDLFSRFTVADPDGLKSDNLHRSSSDARSEQLVSTSAGGTESMITHSGYDVF